MGIQAWTGVQTVVIGAETLRTGKMNQDMSLSRGAPMVAAIFLRAQFYTSTQRGEQPQMVSLPGDLTD